MIPDLDNYKTTIVFPFGGDASPFSLERLRAMGWEGDDVRKLDGIDKNDVDVEIKYEEFDGAIRLRAQVITRTTFTFKNVMNDIAADRFAEDVRELIKSGKAPERMRGR